MVAKRNGQIVDFDRERIKTAISKAVHATGEEIAPGLVDDLTESVSEEITASFTEYFPNVEQIQDAVEKQLVKKGLYEISKAYILYRAERERLREEAKKQNIERSLMGQLSVKKRNGQTELFDIKRIKNSIVRASKDYENDISIDLIASEVVKNVYDGVSTDEIDRALILAAVTFVERDPAYGFVSGRLFLQKIYKEAIGESLTNDVLGLAYRRTFISSIKLAVEKGQLDKRLLDFDLERLSYSLMLERDRIMQFIGLQTLYERYYMKIDSRRIELPQAFWMRVAMGLAINEKDKNERALEFYELISSLRFMPSTPTLFHAGTMRPQLSSCYLTTVNDDLDHIFKCLGDNARLSKWSGGLGNDWTNIRATGSQIKSTNVESQGVIPFLKIANDVTAAINRSGKRRGATCAYLETWHMDIEDFLDLRKNTGDERRRTHDMNTSNWIPDVFMKRVLADDLWTLFSPEEVPELHHIYGKKFEKKYMEYEEKARNGQIKKHRVVSASKLWKKMLSMLFETGHPWITFKDPCNIRSPQDHAGVIHSSNLCTEITLNTSEDETAVCNLGSVNLERHVSNGKLDGDILHKTIRTAIRMLDNVIDINYYPTVEAQNANFRHRPIGMGIMAFQDALYKLDIAFDSDRAISFADELMELVSYYAIMSSSELAKERGAYETYPGSKWERGIFPLDTVDLLEEERGTKIEVSRESKLDWQPVRQHVKEFGMRNSNTMAIAPTATIANICNCFPCIEPIYKNIYVKSNMSGEFTVVNSYLIDDLKKIGQWNQDTLDQIKYYDGNIQLITNIPQPIKDKYKEAFEIDPVHAISISAARAKWIDQSQSHNVFMKGASGAKLNEIYIHAWKTGMKTTYYLRSLAASQIEKSSLDANKFGFTQKREYQSMPENKAVETPEKTADENDQPKVCLINDPTCEACQ